MGGVVWISVRIGYMDGHEDWVIVLDWLEIVVVNKANKKELLVKLDIYFIKDMPKNMKILEIWSIFWKIFLNKHHKKLEIYKSITKVLSRRKNKILNHLANDIAHIVINNKKFNLNTFDP